MKSNLPHNINFEFLAEQWDETYDLYKLIIQGGWANENVLGLIEFIRNSSYVKKLYPGTSLGRLLISKPKNGKLDFSQTLIVDSKKDRRTVQLVYNDKNIISNLQDSLKNWQSECDENDIIENFLKFIKWNKNWH